MSQNNHCSSIFPVIRGDLMNTPSLCTASHCYPDDSLMDQLELHTRTLGWIWSAGENLHGYWCELFTPKEVQVFQGSSLEQVLNLALHNTTKMSARSV